jgi:hypothetical protein
MTPPRQINGRLHHPAKTSARHVIASARGTGIKDKDIRQVLAGAKLGRALPDSEIRDITKGVKIRRLTRLNTFLDECDRKMKMKGLPDEVFLSIQKARVELMSELSVLTKELDEISKSGASNGYGQIAPHSFGPREQIGNVTAVQVNIGKAPEQAPVTDGHLSTIRS